MRATTPALDALLYASDKMIMAQFISIVCRDGTTLNWTNYDANLTVDSVSYTVFPFTAELPRITGGVESTQLRLTVAPGLAQIGGVAFQLLASRGKFDSANFSLSYAFMSSGLTPVGMTKIFTGRIERVKPGSTECVFDIENLFTDLTNQRFPKRNIQMVCPYVLYGTQCGVNSASFNQAVTATYYDSGTLRIDTNITASRGGAGGYAVSTNGSNIGEIRSIQLTGTITDYTTISGTKVWGKNMRPMVSGTVVSSFIVLANPFTYPVTSGSTFFLYDGCDRTGYTCSASFNNITRFGGFPEIPQAAEE